MFEMYDVLSRETRFDSGVGKLVHKTEEETGNDDILTNNVLFYIAIIVGLCLLFKFIQIIVKNRAWRIVIDKVIPKEKKIELNMLEKATANSCSGFEEPLLGESGEKKT